MNIRSKWLLIIPAMLFWFGFSGNAHAELMSSPATECQPYLAKDTAKLNRGGNRIYNKNKTASVWVVCPVARVANSMSLGNYGYAIGIKTQFNSYTYPYYNIGLTCTYKNLNYDGTTYYTKTSTLPSSGSEMFLEMPWWADDPSLIGNYWTVSCKLPPEGAIYGIATSFVAS